MGTNEQSAPKVDVLAVMRRMHLQANACRSGGAGSGTQDFEDESAITAVAELIAAAKLATEEKYHDGTSSREACDRLVAALTRIGSAA